MAPGIEEVRVALERVLNSETFASSERHRAFLQFIVEETLAGRSERLKGFTIAVEVYGKDEDFDAQNDPYVRVEAGRLRKRLAEYYFAEGADDPVLIQLKRGGYVPEFSLAEAGVEAATAQEPAPAHTGLKRARSALLGATVLAAVILLVNWFTSAPLPLESEVANAAPPRIRVQSFDNIGDSEFDYFADGLTTELLVDLDRYQTVWGPLEVFLDNDFAELDVSQVHDYVLGGTVSRIADSIRVTARLVDATSGVLLWTKAFDRAYELSDLFALQDEFSMAIANVLRDPSGPVAVSEIARIAGRTEESLTAYECNVLFLAAFRVIERGARDAARACLQRHDQADELDAAGLAALSILYHLDYQNGEDLLDDSEPAVDAAYDAAQRALDRDGTEIMAHAAMAFVNLDRQRFAQARASTERMMTLNPSPSILGVVAQLLIQSGNGDDGMMIFADINTEDSPLMPWQFLAPAIYHLSRGETDLALNYAERVDAPEFLLPQVFWAALTAELGDTARAQRHTDVILTMHPEFATYGDELIRRWSMPDGVVEQLIAGLELSGINFI